MEKPKPIPVIRPTKEQRDWINKEMRRTGNSEAAVIRSLIDEKMRSGK